MSELRQDRRFIAQVIENLPDLSTEVKQGWIENPKALKKVLAEVLCPPPLKPEFKVWKTLKLGTHKTAEDLRKAVEVAGMKDEWDNEFDKLAFKVNETQIEVDLVSVSVAELGFKDIARYEDICSRAKDFGLELCPAEVGFQIRLQYADEPKGRLGVGMEPIFDSRADVYRFFEVTKSGWLWLDAGRGYVGTCYGLDTIYRLVFVLPRK